MDIFLPLASAFILTILAVPPTIALAKRFNLLDNPKLRPHPAHTQDRIVPRAGGLAIFLGIVISILILVPMEKYTIGIIAALTILLITGLLDDKFSNFNPYLRLSLQLLAALIAVASGIGISFITSPLGGTFQLDQLVIPFNFIGTHQIVVLADFFALFWIVSIMNVVNWSKGVDGQMPSIIFVAALVIGYVAYGFYTSGDPNQLPISTLSFITAGAALGFLIFNWYPAKIFPGFSGSTILGFMIATLSILSSAKLATALLVLLIPVIDALYTIIRRVLSGHSPVWADKGHLHHKLLRLGWSHPKIALFYLSTCAILGFLATILPSQEKLLTTVVVGSLAFAFIFGLHITIKDKTK